MVASRYEFSFLFVKNNILLTRCAHSWNIVYHSKIKFKSLHGHVIFYVF